MSNIERYKEVEQQILWVKNTLNKGEYKVAGLGVDISVGQDGPFESFSFGVYSGIEQQLLELVLRGLEETRHYIHQNLLKEQQELNKFMDSI